MTPTTSATSEKIYYDSYFDIAFTYAKGWTMATKMDKNRDCQLAKKFMRTPCAAEELTTETLSVNSAEKNSAGRAYGITISAATEGLGFACGESATMSQIKVKSFNFDLCTNGTTGEQNALGQMEVAGPKSDWKAILVSFSAKNEVMKDMILAVLTSIK